VYGWALQVVCDVPAAEKLAQEADDIEEAMAAEFANRSAQVRQVLWEKTACSLVQIMPLPWIVGLCCW
jgi:hypothetical protein